MGGIEKHQLFIIMGLALSISGLILYFAYSDGESSNEGEPMQAQDQNGVILPSIPGETVEKQVDNRLDLIREKNQLAEEQKRIAMAQETEINLDIFSDLNKTEKPAPEEPASKEPPIQQPKPKQRTQTAYKPQQPVQQPAKKESAPAVEQQQEADPWAFVSVYDESASKEEEDPGQITVKAVIHDQATVKTGSRVTIRTTEEVEIDGKVIRANSFLLATVYLRNRVEFSLPRMTFDDGTYVNQNFILYDENDGKKGLYSQELLASEGTQQTTSDLVNDISDDVNSGVARGIIQNLGQRKIREPEVNLKRNHKVILKSN
ncbi:MAG: conjugative transposon protein TraM [Bacteroidota bacterium]